MDLNMTEKSRKRPGWVWVIFLYTVLTNAFLAYILYLMFTKQMSSKDAETQTAMEGFVLFDYILALISIGINLIAVTFLFVLSKRAHVLYKIVLILNVMTGAYTLASMPSIEGVGNLLFGLLVTILIIGYTKRLIEAKVLT